MQLLQVFEVWLVAVEKVPLGQLTHSVTALLPVVVANVPAGHARHWVSAEAPNVAE